MDSLLGPTVRAKSVKCKPVRQCCLPSHSGSKGSKDKLGGRRGWTKKRTSQTWTSKFQAHGQPV